MSDLLQHRIAAPRRARHAILLVAATVAASAITTPAWAGVSNPPRAAHQIISFPERDFVSSTGYDPATRVTVEAWRNGHLIGRSGPITPAAPDGLVEVNHPGGGCWVASTPDLQPGDSVRVVEADGVTADETTTANVTATPATSPAGGTVVVHGTAMTAAGGQIPIDQVEQRIVANKQAFDANGRRTLRATSAGVDGTLRYDAPGSTSWTATYTGLTGHDVDMAVNPALNNETRILWLGADPVAATEQTIFETAPDPVAAAFVPGPSAPCTAPAATTTILAMSRSVVNVANAAQPIVIDGVATLAETDHVQVQVGGFTQTVAVTPDPGANPVTGAWSVTIPADALAALPQGASTLTTTYQGVAPRTPQTRTVTKDTIAPPAPAATPAAGTFAVTQVIALNDADQSARIFYTNNGADPGASGVRFVGQITITASQTIRAIAIDPAGNPSAVSAFPFIIAPGAGVLGTGAGVVGGAVGAGLLPKPAAKPRALGAVSLRARITRTSLRARGLRIAMVLRSSAHVVRIRVFRAGRNGPRTGSPLLSTFRLPAGAGTLRVTLRSRSLLARMRPGRYVVEVAAGDSRTLLEAAVTRPVTVTRR